MRTEQSMRRKRRVGIVLLCIGAAVMALTLVGRAMAPATMGFARVVTMSFGPNADPPTTTTWSRTFFADELGYRRATPRDSIRVAIDHWAPLILNCREAPRWLVYESTRVRMHHNGFGGKVSPWTELPESDMKAILSAYRPRLAEAFGDGDADYPRPVTQDRAKGLINELETGSLRTRSFHVVWSYIPVNVYWLMVRPWWSALVGVVIGVGAMFLIGGLSRQPHRCMKCGYDLRGLEADKPCPECGNTSKAPEVTP